ncbi:hypothetical protein J416_07637 [Gracilibacillus halophilus YIM-C55.5]|uniref:TVP38/TMEM64 family membrane protein n=1 Tax=Gracilibacillus halophilus YIM-C55.5 TaxID=1308866 RepID=N4WRP3_9BACI|nr:VTT domain-containing protein [Gracilibacillus halophilus]ENH97050.1 hypothetical protein J416_07637 [Gracilibacillus halophilus YIM-C55.5]
MVWELLYQIKWVENYAFLAPIVFICLHMIRPLFFVPVLLLCITGGLLFGFVAGTVYSIIGLTLSSLLFYQLIHWVDPLRKRFENIKQKLFGDRQTLNLTQITLLRMVPFIHFHLLSFWLYERSNNKKAYLQKTLISVVPVTLLYTSLGQSIQEIPLPYVLLATSIICVIAFLMRNKQAVIKWQHFFSTSST